jgi:hypothetical protein
MAGSLTHKIDTQVLGDIPFWKMRERRKKAAQNVSGIRRMALKQANAAKKGDPFKSFTEFDNSSRTYLCRRKDFHG